MQICTICEVFSPAKAINFRLAQKADGMRYGKVQLRADTRPAIYDDVVDILGTTVWKFNIAVSSLMMSGIPQCWSIIRLAQKGWIGWGKESSVMLDLCWWTVSPESTQTLLKHQTTIDRARCGIDFKRLAQHVTMCRKLSSGPKIIRKHLLTKPFYMSASESVCVMKIPPSADINKQQHQQPQQCLDRELIAIQCGWSPW